MTSYPKLLLFFSLIFLLTGCKNNDAEAGKKYCKDAKKGEECIPDPIRPEFVGKKWDCQGKQASKEWRCKTKDE